MLWKSFSVDQRMFCREENLPLSSDEEKGQENRSKVRWVCTFVSFPLQFSYASGDCEHFRLASMLLSYGFRILEQMSNRFGKVGEPLKEFVRLRYQAVFSQLHWCDFLDNSTHRVSIRD